jgi:hypothetical protein
LSTPDRLVPDTHAYTHDGQRQVPHHRPDIRAQLTGSFTDVDQRFIKERRVVSLPRGRPSLPADRLRSARRGACLSIALVTRHGIPSSNAGTTTRVDRAPPRRAIRSHRARPKATAAATPTKPPAVVRYRRPADRRSRPQQWADVGSNTGEPAGQFQEWRDNLPSSLDIARRLGSPRSRRRAPGGQTAKGFGRDCRRSSLTRRRLGRAKSACHFRGRSLIASLLSIAFCLL